MTKSECISTNITEESNEIVCSLDEEPECSDNLPQGQDSLNISSNWRDESLKDDFDEDEDDFSEEDDDYDDEEEEAAEEWLNKYYLRQRGLPAALSCLPSSIKISLVPETLEDKLRREEKQREELGNTLITINIYCHNYNFS